MTFKRSALALSAALMMVTSLQTAAFASVASENRAFNGIVAQAVQGLKNDFVNQMNARERRAWNACVQRIYAGVPQGRKRYVLAGKTSNDRKKRLETLSLENRAAVRKAIAQKC